MVELLGSQTSIAGFLAVIVLLLCTQLVVRVGTFAWDLLKKKSELSEKSLDRLGQTIERNTEAVSKLERRIEGIERDIASLPKFELDVRRAFRALKLLAGDRWSAITKDIMEEGFSK